MSWFIFTFLMFLGSLRSTAGLALLFFFLTLTFMMLMIGAFLVNEKATKAGGGLGLVTAAIAYYCASAHIITSQTSYFPLPIGHLPKND
jgi:succinate-acetate transporter protein